jgi:hypothetical protein
MQRDAINPELELKRLQRSMNMKWILILIFLLVTSFFVWLVYKNALSIRLSYMNYRHNLNASNVSAAVGGNLAGATIPPEDDETYDMPEESRDDKHHGTYDNQSISNNLIALKALYKPYNTLVRKMKPKASDQIDEKILSNKYDNYPRKKDDDAR